MCLHDHGKSSKQARQYDGRAIAASEVKSCAHVGVNLIRVTKTIVNDIAVRVGVLVLVVLGRWGGGVDTRWVLGSALPGISRDSTSRNTCACRNNLQGSWFGSRSRTDSAHRNGQRIDYSAPCTGSRESSASTRKHSVSSRYRTHS